MTITFSPLDTATLLGVFTHTEALPGYFRKLFVGSEVTSTDEYLDMEKIVKSRKIAPLVTPNVEGRPVYKESANLSRFKVAYSKMKDAVDPSRVIKRRPSEILNPNPLTPMQRHDAIIGDIAQEHRDLLERRYEKLVADAVIYGAVTLEGEEYQSRTISFGRDAGHTVAKAGAARWDQSPAIMADLNSWIQTMRRAKFGGPTNRITLGQNVVEPFLADGGVRALLDTTVKQPPVDLNTGLREGTRDEYIGQINNIPIWVAGDSYEDKNGTEIRYMPDNDVLLSGPNVGGIMAYGAIYDKKAGYAALKMFPSMWDENDPSVTMFMTQSAPLFIPVNPNNTFRATVL